jgi:hypothetical protein
MALVRFHTSSVKHELISLPSVRIVLSSTDKLTIIALYTHKLIVKHCIIAIEQKLLNLFGSQFHTSSVKHNKGPVINQ